MQERKLSAAPRWLILSVVLLLAAQIGWRTQQTLPHARAEALTPPPGVTQIRLATLDEPLAAGGLLTLRLQAFDNQPGISLPFAALDYTRLEAWLAVLLQLDPQAQYPLLMASHLYAQIPDAGKQRQMLDFTYRAYMADPGKRWRFLAHAALIARHRLHDLPLALHYARALQAHAGNPAIPHWASQMSILLLQDMGEVEAAKIELGGLLANGSIRDPNEIRFLTERYRELSEKPSRPRQQR